jgi:hypothetical protein
MDKPISKTALRSILFDQYKHSLPPSQKNIIVEIINVQMKALELTMGNLHLLYFRVMQHHKEFIKEGKIR